jgi:hypothetical protein
MFSMTQATGPSLASWLFLRAGLLWPVRLVTSVGRRTSAHRRKSCPVGGISPGQTAGFLGRGQDPFGIEGDRWTARFSRGEVDLPSELTAQRRIVRRSLLPDLEDGRNSCPSMVELEGPR